MGRRIVVMKLIYSLGLSAPLQLRFGSQRLLAVPKTEIAVKKK
jgi:hypothetical protein